MTGRLQKTRKNVDKLNEKIKKDWETELKNQDEYLGQTARKKVAENVPQKLPKQNVSGPKKLEDEPTQEEIKAQPKKVKKGAYQHAPGPEFDSSRT